MLEEADGHRRAKKYPLNCPIAEVRLLDTNTVVWEGRVGQGRKVCGRECV